MKILKKSFLLILLLILPLISCGFTFSSKETEIFIPAIMYHSIHPKRNNAYVLSPAKLEQDLIYIRDNGFTPIFISEIISYVDGQGELPQKPVVLTFDDGFYNNYTFVYPLMEKYNMKCNVSIVGSYADKEQGNQNDFYSYLSWEEIAKLSQTPYFEFHNHSYNMHNLSSERNGVKRRYGESEEEYKNALIEDAKKCMEKLSKATGKKSLCYCYPFGIFNEDSDNILQNLGYRVFMTCTEKVNKIEKDSKVVKINRYNRACWYSTYEFFEKIK